MSQKIPPYDSLMLSVAESLQNLGGTASNRVIGDYVFHSLSLPDDTKEQVLYRLVWVRSYLKKCGIINNQERALWSLNGAFLDSDSEELRNTIVERYCQL